MDRKYSVLLLLLPVILLALSLITSLQHWLWVPVPHLYSNTKTLTPWQANVKALSFLKLQEEQLLATLNTTIEAQKEKYLVDELKTIQELQHTLSKSNANLQVQVDTLGCKKLRAEEIARPAEEVAWRLNEGRFLIMLCNSGQVTNHLICLQKHMLFGALLNRTLVLPHESLDYKYAHLLDIAHIKKCLGDNRVISFEEFEERTRNKSLHINKLICYMPNCYFDSDHQAKWETLGFTFGDRQDAWPSDDLKATSFPNSHILAHEILTRFSCEDEVIAVGDLYYANLPDIESLPVSHKCRNLVQPHPLIVLTAQRFVQTYMGSNFLSLHFRRHGFLVFCNRQSPSCFYPVPQVARCIQKQLQRSNTTIIFMSTDASESEITELKALVSAPLVMRTMSHEPEAKWDALLWRKGLESDPAVMSMLDKAIAAMGVVFIGTRGSTFSDDIQRMRNEWGSAATCDGNICDEEVPSFLAEIP